MSIRTVCPNGHTLKIKDKYAGKLGRCPICDARVRVPVVDVESMSSFSGESIMLASSPEADDSPPAKADEAVKTCARCSASVPPLRHQYSDPARVACPHPSAAGGGPAG